eukprot:gene15910-11386_t
MKDITLRHLLSVTALWWALLSTAASVNYEFTLSYTLAGDPSDRLGTSVAFNFDGSGLLVGSPFSSSIYSGAGSAAYYEIGSSVVQKRATITSATINSVMRFGRSVATNTDGTVIAIGAPEYAGSGTGRGVVLVFDYDASGSSWQGRLPVEGSVDNEKSGFAVALDSTGATLAIASPNYNSDAGRVCVYDYDSSNSAWNLRVGCVTKTNGVYFGQAIDLTPDGSTLVVGSPYSSVGATGSAGFFCVYQSASTSQMFAQTFCSTAVYGRDTLLGYSLAISDDADIIVVGFPGNSTMRGGVEVFYSTGSSYLPASLGLRGAKAGDCLGDPVRISGSGDYFLATATYGFYTRLYRYDNSAKTATLMQTFTEGRSTSSFGASLAMNYAGTRLAIGSPLAVSGDVFGYSLAMTTDGGVVAVASTGSVAVYGLQAGALWQMGATLVGSDSTFGAAIALNAAGSVVAVGQPSTSGAGTVYVRQYNGTLWKATGSAVQASASTDYFGAAVALSSIGDLLAAAAPAADSFKGRVYLWKYATGAWSLYNSPLAGDSSLLHPDKDYVFNGRYAFLAADATLSTVAMGQSDYSSTAHAKCGRVCVYSVSGGEWARLGSDLVGSAAGEHFGIATAMSLSGTVVAVATRTASGSAYYGSVRVFAYDYGVGDWVAMGANVSVSASQEFGCSLALSADGSVLAVGGNMDASGSVRTYVFDRSANSWLSLAQTLDGDSSGDRFGSQVALTTAGTTLAASSSRGSSYVKLLTLVDVPTGQPTREPTSQPSSSEYYGFRIQQSTDNDGWGTCYLNLADVYIYSFAGTQIAPSAYVFPSPMSEYPASNCFDGNSATFCHTDGTCSSSYL